MTRTNTPTLHQANALAWTNIPTIRGDDRTARVYALFRDEVDGMYYLTVHKAMRGHRPRQYAAHDELDKALQHYWNDIRAVIRAQNIDNAREPKVKAMRSTFGPAEEDRENF